jgi:hypothetical protein
MKKQKDVLFPRVTHCVAIKRKYFSHPLFGVYLIFLSFSIILESLKKNKIMLRYKGGTSVTNILVPSARNTLILRERRHVKEKDTRENSSMDQGVKMQRQSATRLVYKACFKGSDESNMELTLGQNARIQMRLTGHNDNALQCNFNEPREGKLGGFSFLESLKRCKRRLH